MALEQASEMGASEKPTGQSPSTASSSPVLTTAKGGGILFVSMVTAHLIRFLTGVLVARSLGSESLGLYSLALTAAGIAHALASLGLSTAVVRFVSLFAGRRDEAGLWGTLQIGIAVPVGVSALAGIGLFFLAGPIANQLFHEPKLVPLLRIVSFVIPFMVLLRQSNAATRGLAKMQYTAIVNVLRVLLVLLLMILLSITIGLSARVAVVVFGIATIFAAILALSALNRLFSLRRPLRQARRDPKAMFRFALPVYLSTLIVTFRPSIKTLLLGTMASIASVGIFSVASQITSAGTMFHSALSISSAPEVSKLHDRGARKQLAHLYQTVTKWSFALNLPLFLVTVLFPVQILLIFGESFASGAVALAILACASLVHTGTGICGVVLDMSGNTQLKTLNSVIVTGITVGLNVWLIPRWGLLGAALASLASVSILNGLRLAVVFILFRMLPYNRSFLKPILSGLGAMFVGWGVYRLLSLEMEWLQTAIAAAMLLMTYAGILLLLGLSEEDRAVLSLVAQRIVPDRSGRSPVNEG